MIWEMLKHFFLVAAYVLFVISLKKGDYHSAVMWFGGVYLFSMLVLYSKIQKVEDKIEYGNSVLYNKLLECKEVKK